MFTVLEAIDWRWPPDVILRQPEALLKDVLEIALAKQKLERLKKG